MSALLEARAKGQAGAEQAANNCGPEWMESALTCVRWFSKVMQRKDDYYWTIEECRLWSYAHDLPVAASERAWGQVARIAMREGLIEPTGGYAPTIASRGSVRALYRKA